MDIDITFLQADLAWQDIGENLRRFSAEIDRIGKTDLIILPEMFTTGFTMDSANMSERMDGETIRAMKFWAQSKSAPIVGSLIIEEDGHHYNRLIWMNPDGSFHKYDKRHLFRISGENEHFSPGKEKTHIEYKGWKFCPMICYDLRFPVWSRSQDCDCLIYVANWPEKRISHWETLLRARAIENQCYVVGVNRTGIDGNGHSYCASSMAVDYSGNRLNKGNETIQTVRLSKSELNEFRKVFPAWMDADEFKIK
jgi:omega-amidase